MALAWTATAEQQPLKWTDGTLLKPIENKMIHAQLGSDEFVGHITKLGVQTNDGGIKITRTSTLSYGDTLVVPFIFILVEPVTIVAIAGEELEFYNAMHTKVLGAVVSTAGIAETTSFQPVLLDLGDADALGNLLCQDAAVQFASSQWMRRLSVTWTQALLKFDTHVSFSDASFIQLAEDQGKAVLRAKGRGALKTGEVLLSRTTQLVTVSIHSTFQAPTFPLTLQVNRRVSSMSMRPVLQLPPPLLLSACLHRSPRHRSPRLPPPHLPSPRLPSPRHPLPFRALPRHPSMRAIMLNPPSMNLP